MGQLTKLGSESASSVLYINNTPIWSDSDSLNIPLLIEKNGNHWRKICTIFAKLMTTDDWRDYRDQKLLQHCELICFSQQIEVQAKIHLFCGKESWKRFEDTVTQLTKTEHYESIAEGKITYKIAPTGELFIFTPYFDSRQFPNVLIAELKEQLLVSRL